MTTTEKIAALETRIEQLEKTIAKPAPTATMNSFQRLVDDGRGRGVVVTVGGNNGGY